MKLSRFRRILIPPAILILCWLSFQLPITRQLLSLLRLSTYDLVLDIYNAFSDRDLEPVIEDIVIVDIDEESIGKLGQFSSWPGLYFADLVDSLATDSPILIGFDVFFTESDRINAFGLSRLSTYMKQRGVDPGNFFAHYSFDEQFARSVESAGNVYLGMFNSNAAPDSIYLPSTLRGWRIPGAKSLAAPYPKAPVPILAEAARGVGFADIEPDLSGVIHDYPLFFQYADSLYVNFSFQACLDLLGVDEMALDRHLILKSGGEEVCTLPLDHDQRLFLNYYGKARRFRYVSFSDVLMGRIPEGFFSDKIVLVGSSASGLRDIKTTPLEADYPGVELHATLIMNVLAGEFIHFVPLGWNWLFAAFLVLLLALSLRYLKPHYSLILFLMASLLMLLLFIGLFAQYRLCPDYSILISAWVLAYLALLINESQMQFSEKKKVRNAFEHYVSKSVISQIMKIDNLLQVGGKRQSASILFSDIRDFSSICELLPAEAVSDFLHEHFNRSTKVLTRHNGTLDKYIGDALLGLFNVPLPHPNYQLDACNAAWNIISEAQALRSEYAKHEVLSSFRNGVGIATGEIIVGNFGSDEIFNFTGIGDKMNLASRLESLNKIYHCSIIIDSATYEAVKEHYLCRWLDRVCVKGKGEALDIYELMAPSSEADEQQIELCRCYAQALQAMINSELETAQKAFDQCRTILPQDYPSQLMISRLQNLDFECWDGVWHYQNK